MNDLNQKLIITLVILPTFLCIFLGYKEASVSVIAVALALLFTNIDKVSYFKMTGLEAKLRDTINDANAKIDELRELGLSLSTPIVDEMAVSGRLGQFIPLKYKLQRVAKIEDTLRKLGATDEQINEACSTIYGRVRGDHVRRIMYSLKGANAGKDALFQGIDEGKFDDWDMPQIQKFIEDNKLQKSKDTDESIMDFDYFLKTKKLRREDAWQS